ncbi:2-C-methyl-D-erythritol 4-phosphate cytidylyltransferase [Roseimaritima sediminicola]|uniref:2-C-methyl-D-erythritol 4-phosphate cytidylyltransferase n=1 Tax=Roseimaritima sediminicola TaxID=2662066 RepID=UPI00129843F6|nr:2-C-methyl-D-erythritol 4-phosphate cytidylyltransferase [Roseimaritima sediminicola]
MSPSESSPAEASPSESSLAGEAANVPPGSVAAILPAAGQSRRFAERGEKKIFVSLAGKPVWRHAAETLRSCPAIGPIILAVADSDRPRWQQCEAELRRLDITLCSGGAARSDSVNNGLQLVGEAALVAIHDAARPLLPPEDLQNVVAAAQRSGAALLATPVRATLKKADDDLSACHTVDRRRVWEALTPQVFRTSVLRNAYARWQGRPATDDAELVERSGHAVQIVPGSAINLKITLPEDLDIAAALLNA